MTLHNLSNQIVNPSIKKTKPHEFFVVCMMCSLIRSKNKHQFRRYNVIVPCCTSELSLSLCGLGGLQHFAILLKYIIHVAIPDIPGWVAEEMAKLEYRRREAFKV